MSNNLNFNFEEELNKCKTIEDLTGKNGLVKKMIKNMMEHLLEKEMEDHLGYKKHAIDGHNSGNSRNGKNTKTVKSTFGQIDLDIPRDRNASFTPQIVKKRQRDINSFDEKIISMYAKGMTTRDIQDHIEDIYGVELSPTMVSNITNKVLEVANEWQSRPLDVLYPIVFFDAIHYKVREDNKVVVKAAYTCFGINIDGRKEVLGLWVGENEGATFWLRVCTELKNRGIKDILIACMDGLKGLPEAIKSEFPKVEIQLCIVHMIRNSLKYIPHKSLKEFISDLKEVYKAPTESAGENNLLKLQEKWEKKYPLAVKSWINNWENIKTFFRFPEEIRTIMYTTNAIEALHRQFRKVTKSRAIFPSNEALFKMLYLSVKDISKKWTLPIKNWRSILSHLSIAFEDRMNIEAIN